MSDDLNHGTPPSTDPVSPVLPVMPADETLLWAFRGCLALAALAIFFSWFQMSMSGMPLPIEASRGMSRTASGYEASSWAKLVFLCAAGGIALTFLGDKIKNPGTYVSAATIATLLLVVIAMISIGPGGDDAKMMIAMGLKISLAWGAWLSLLAAIGAVVLRVKTWGSDDWFAKQLDGVMSKSKASTPPPGAGPV